MENFIITDFLGCFYARDKKGRKIEFESRRAACFILTMHGKIAFSSGKTVVFSDPEHAVFLPEGLRYTNECLADAESVVFNFYTKAPSSVPRTLTALPAVRAKEAYKTVKKASASLSAESHAAIFRELYALASELFATAEKPAASDAIVTRAVEYMMENYADASLTVEKVAAACFISEIYLRKLFAKKYGTTPFKMLTDIRMKKAYLLAKEKRPIGEIATAVGYSAVCQFSRAYKRYYGHSPSET